MESGVDKKSLPAAEVLGELFVYLPRLVCGDGVARMKERKGTGTDGKKDLVIVTKSDRCVSHLGDAGTDRLLQAIFGTPELRLATEGVEYKPLWLVNEPRDRPNLRLVRD